jgi:hypothetical protein
MYCPRCRTEYREGFVECADCRVPLAAGLPPERQETPGLDAADLLRGREPELVTVLDTADPFAVRLARASLDDAGIEYLMTGEDSRPYPGLGAGCSIQVALEREKEARELLGPLQEPLAGTDELPTE